MSLQFLLSECFFKFGTLCDGCYYYHFVSLRTERELGILPGPFYCPERCHIREVSIVVINLIILLMVIIIIIFVTISSILSGRVRGFDLTNYVNLWHQLSAA